MPTVIDSLIVEIGLDPSKLTKGQKEAIKSLHDTTEAALKQGKAIEESSKRSAEFLGALNTRMLAFGSLLTSSAITGAVIGFAGKLTQQDAAAGRLAYTLGTNVNTLDKWRNAAYLVGGSSEGITASIQGLTNQFQDFAITGESAVIPWFRALNVNIADSEGKMRPFEAIMHDLANSFQKLSPEKAAAFGRNMGLDAGTINLLIKGGDELDRILKISGQLSTLNAQSAENATKLAAAWAKWELAITGVGRSLLNLATPGLLSLMGSQTGTLDELSKGQFLSKGSLLDHFYNGTPFRGFGPKSSGGSSGAFASSDEKEAYIRAEAAKRGISPDVAVQVAKSEGFKTYSGDYDATGKPTSFGSFQLHYPGIGRNTADGLGSAFTKKTGLDARNPDTEREQIQFALDQAKQGGWGPWHGWKGSEWAGIGGGAGGGSKSETTIETINIQTQATDSVGIASTIAPAIQRSSDTYHSQGGPQ